MAAAVSRKKPWYTSRLVWLGILQLGVGLADLVAKAEVLGPETNGVALTVMGMLTMVLRAVTTQPVGLSSESPVSDSFYPPDEAYKSRR